MIRTISILLALLPLMAGGQTNYFAVTAKANGLESAYSTEVCAVDKRWVLLAWDTVPEAQGYVVYWGTSPRNYTHKKDVGTNRVELILKDFWTVTPLQSESMNGPWTRVANWPALTLTNLPGNRFYKLDIR